MNKLLPSIFILFSILLTSCASSDNGRYTKSDHVTNTLEKKIQKPWKEIKSEGSEAISIHSQLLFLQGWIILKYSRELLPPTRTVKPF
jgi:hypothetical protein